MMCSTLTQRPWTRSLTAAGFACFGMAAQAQTTVENGEIVYSSIDAVPLKKKADELKTAFLEVVSHEAG